MLSSVHTSRLCADPGERVDNAKVVTVGTQLHFMTVRVMSSSRTELQSSHDGRSRRARKPSRETGSTAMHDNRHKCMCLSLLTDHQDGDLLSSCNNGIEFEV